MIAGIRRYWTELRPASPRKVVGIGLPKTGTTSLGYCFRRLGYKHRSFDMDLAVRARRDDTEPALSEAERFEAFEDWPWFLLFREFDRRFPGSKFILTLRSDTDTYLKSLRGHHDRQGIRKPEFVKPHWWDGVFGFPPGQWDYQRSGQRYERHNRAVIEYFRGRDDLLVVCWESGDGWEQLCRFLGRPCPSEPFPHIR